MSDIEEPDSSLESIRERLRALGGDLDRPRTDEPSEPSASPVEEPAVESPPPEPETDAAPTTNPVNGQPAEGDGVESDEPPVEWSAPDSVEIVREEAMVIDEPQQTSALGLSGPEQHHSDLPPSVGPSDDEARDQPIIEPQENSDRTATYLFRIVVFMMFFAGAIAIAIALF